MQRKSANKKHIKAIILAGRRDFGRCPIASRLPLALWPVFGQSAIERLLFALAKQRIDHAVVCSDGDAPLLRQSINVNGVIELQFLDEPFAAGTAGCVRDAANGDSHTLLLVLPANTVNPPSVQELVRAHRDSQADLTVVFNPPDGNDHLLGRPADIYVCNTGILEHIPQDGYFDIKEGLIPEILRVGKTVHAAALTRHAGNFSSMHEYLQSLTNYLQSGPESHEHIRLLKKTESQSLWAEPTARIAPGARIVGTVVVQDGAEISPDTLIVGPTCIGRNVSISKDTVIIRSVLWDDARIGPNCQIQQSLLDRGVTVPADSIVRETAVAPMPPISTAPLSTDRTHGKGHGVLTNSKFHLKLDKIIRKPVSCIRSHKRNILPFFAAGLVLLAFIWSYRQGLTELWRVWCRSDEYSSGFLVPFLAAYVLWSKRDDITRSRIKPAMAGVLAFLAAQGFRLFGLYYMYGSAERLSIVLSIAALVLLLFGWQLFRKLSPVLIFLFLMLPLPNRVQAAVALPLQHLATTSAVFCLETIGYEVLQEGNLIHIGQATIAVSEACNGLRMITAFFVISGLVVLLVKRDWWEKMIVLVSSIPVALLCNTCRLTITSLAFTVLSGEQWEKVFHDFGGYAMMPLALMIVVAELWLLARLTSLPIRKEVVM